MKTNHDIEQKEIIRRVENLFVLADQIEARLRAALGQLDALTRLLLNRATGENRMGILVAEPTAI